MLSGKASVKVLLHEALSQARFAQNATAELCLTREDVEPDAFVLYGKNAEHALLERFDIDGVINGVVRQGLLDLLPLVQAAGYVDQRHLLIVECLRVH